MLKISASFMNNFYASAIIRIIEIVIKYILSILSIPSYISWLTSPKYSCLKFYTGISSLLLFSLLLLYLIFRILKMSIANQIERDPTLTDYKTAMYLPKRRNMQTCLSIKENLQTGKVSEFKNSLSVFKYQKIQGLTPMNIILVKKDFCFLQCSFILNDLEGKTAVFERLGPDKGVKVKITKGCSIFRAWSPINIFNKTYLTSSIKKRIGIVDDRFIKSISPLGIGYNELKSNGDIVRYFFIFYRVIVRKHPLTQSSLGDDSKTHKKGDLINEFTDLKTNATLTDCFQANMDKVIYEFLVQDDTEKIPVSRNYDGANCFVIPLKEDILGIKKYSRDKR